MSDLSENTKSLNISSKSPDPPDDWETASLSSLEDGEPASVDPPPPTPTSPHSHRRGSSATLGVYNPNPATRFVGDVKEDVDEEEKAAGASKEKPDTRPATTDAAARRMIAAALGVRTRSTKEQREYDAALREKERKRREEERERKRQEEREAEEAKRKVWED